MLFRSGEVEKVLLRLGFTLTDVPDSHLCCGSAGTYALTHPDLARQLREFVMSMLAKDPLDRPKDALVVSRTLARIERRLLDQQTEMTDSTMITSGSRLPRRVSSTPRIVMEAPASLLGGNKQ